MPLEFCLLWQYVCLQLKYKRYSSSQLGEVPRLGLMAVAMQSLMGETPSGRRCIASLYPTPHTLHPTPYTLHPTPYSQ
ncbi:MULTISPECIES: hypothetical protein [unclassified Moorena]|uniref:hypothetical protein n=1 Tax=unclassified Moorena TaxID=2683338 RepID=UPI0013C99A89|nr:MULTISPECIES: hypothetical protein [unclassified Moorena]NEO20022.1 hypothetical protein [Moorena sp. SIO4A5]NEQ60652.1 hypothetical protein [Moorena sp. SIO4A1]